MKVTIGKGKGVITYNKFSFLEFIQYFLSLFMKASINTLIKGKYF